MTFPTDYRGTAVAATKTALELIQQGAEYRTTAKNVELSPESILTVPASQCPAYTVYAEDERDEADTSHRNRESIDIVVECMFYMDQHEWRGMAVTEVLDWIVADMKKALDTDRTRGISGIFKGRTITTLFDKQSGGEVFGVVFLTDTIEYRRPCPP